MTPRVSGISIQAGDKIIHNTQLADANKESTKNWGERIADGLGSTLTKIALLIAMASIIGKCLMDSGGAERIRIRARSVSSSAMTRILRTWTPTSSAVSLSVGRNS